jgi:hypothetical protein
VDYDGTVNDKVEVIEGYEAFFKTTDTDKCPIESCTLYNNDCVTLYDQGSELEMS